MLTLYTWTTPNGRKPLIMLEEAGLAYTTVPVNIGKDEQFAPDFLAVSPNNKIPALVDDDAPGGSLALFESGAILTYLAEKTGRFLPSDAHGRAAVQTWLHWQIGGLGPMLGQLGFFAVRSKEKAPLAISRFTDECSRLLRVMNTRLGAVPYLGGQDYSIADMAAYPWLEAASRMMAEPLAGALAEAGHLQDWMGRVGSRPAVQKAMAIEMAAT